MSQNFNLKSFAVQELSTKIYPCGTLFPSAPSPPPGANRIKLRHISHIYIEVHLQNSLKIWPEWFIFHILPLYFVLMLLGCRDCTSFGINSGSIFHILFLDFILMLLGCRDRTPLGMNSGYIATSQLTSSGTDKTSRIYHINYARLAIKLAEWKIQDINGGWIQVTSLHRDKFH